MSENKAKGPPAHRFSPGYKDNLFYEWYRLGKPSMRSFYSNVADENAVVGRPSIVTVSNWYNDEWKERAAELDMEVQTVLKETQIAEQVAMMKRHGETGRKMQEMSLNWLVEHQDELTPGTAVRMLVDGIEIERGTAGIPEALEKLRNRKDEDLLDEIGQLIADTPLDADN